MTMNTTRNQKRKKTWTEHEVMIQGNIVGVNMKYTSTTKKEQLSKSTSQNMMCWHDEKKWLSCNMNQSQVGALQESVEYNGLQEWVKISHNNEWSHQTRNRGNPWWDDSARMSEPWIATMSGHNGMEQNMTEDGQQKNVTGENMKWCGDQIRGRVWMMISQKRNLGFTTHKTCWQATMQMIAIEVENNEKDQPWEMWWRRLSRFRMKQVMQEN